MGLLEEEIIDMRLTANRKHTRAGKWIAFLKILVILRFMG
jgi:hypothetical protein